MSQSSIRSLIYCLLICGVIWMALIIKILRYGGVQWLTPISNSGRAVMMRKPLKLAPLEVLRDCLKVAF